MDRDELLALDKEGPVELILRLAERARPRYQEIRETVRGSPVVNSDETGARVNGQTHWHRTFQTPMASYHLIVASRAGTVIDEFLDGVEPEVWGSNLYAPQMLTAARQHQICLSHENRELAFASQADREGTHEWRTAVRP